jgi:hypothetical protein
MRVILLSTSYPPVSNTLVDFPPYTGGDNSVGRLETYRAYVQELLARHAQRYPVCTDVEVQTLFDMERDHYQVLLVGWEDLQRVYPCVCCTWIFVRTRSGFRRIA